MAITYTAIRVADGFDLSTASLPNVSDAYVLRLPFRLRVGRLRRFVIDGDGPVEVWCRNTVSIPRSTQWSAKWARVAPERLNTEVLLCVKRRQVSPDDLAEIKKAEPSLVALAPPPIFETLEILTAFLNAYRKIGFDHPTLVTPDEAYSVVEPLTVRQFDDCQRALFLRVGPGDSALCDADVREMFRAKPAPSMFRNHGIEALRDFPDDVLDRLPREVERHRKHVFPEFASLAASRKLAQDRVFALLMAVTALEGAHAAFVRVAIPQKVGEEEQRRPVLTNSFLRGLELATALPMTCHWLMGADEQPSPGTIAACAKAIETRNNILHGVADSKGQYGLRKYTESDMYSAYQATMRVYHCFVAALERREGG